MKFKESINVNTLANLLTKDLLAKENLEWLEPDTRDMVLMAKSTKMSEAQLKQFVKTVIVFALTHFVSQEDNE